ncbi:MAG: hypothetical protein JWP12_1662 [Bacteroidetes bacterium]|nr:hypothetical protein [Bacteroidota bacterium]
MKNIKIVLSLSALLFSVNIYAQNVGINGTGATPNASAMLDVNASNKGVLIPQVSLTSLTDATTITTPAASLLIYNTNAAITGGVGYYYNSGTSGSPVWVPMLTSTSTLGQSQTDYYSSGGITVASATGFTLIPGFPVTITVAANTSVLVTGTVGVQCTATGATNYSSVDVVIALDGSLLANGGYDRMVVGNNGGIGSQIRYANFNVSFPSLSVGTHTLAFFSAGTGSGGSNATVGGNNASVLEATMSVTMIKK